MATLKVYNGSTWDAAVSKVWNGSAWEIKMKFWDGSAWVELYATGPSVVVAANKAISNYRLTVSPCYARVKVDNSGWLMESNEAGVLANYEIWLDAGLNSEVWVERVIVSGTLDYDDGSGRLVCSTDRTFGVQQSVTGIKTCTIDLNFYDAASGGTLLDTQRVVLTAEYDSGA